MIIPVKCISCGKVIGEYWDKFQEEIKSGKNQKDVLDSLGLDRYCCRSHMISQVHLIEDITKFRDKVIPKE